MTRVSSSAGSSAGGNAAVPIPLADVRLALEGGAGVMAKAFLHYHGLARGSGDALDDLAQRIIGYVKTGKLSAAAVRGLVREIPEASNKRVHLYKAAQPDKLRRRTAADFQAVVPSLDQAVVPRHAPTPRTSYSLVTPDLLRVSMVETHRVYTADPVRNDLVWEDVRKVVVVEAERATGFVTIAIDAPGYRHPHGDGQLAYYAHYLDVAGTLLDTELFPVPMYNAVIQLGRADRARVRPADLRGRTGSGSMVTMSGGRADLRDDAFYATLDGLKLREQGRFEWLKTADRPPEDGSFALLRPVRVEVDAKQSLVKFTKHTLAREITHVLAEVRALL